MIEEGGVAVYVSSTVPEWTQNVEEETADFLKRNNGNLLCRCELTLQENTLHQAHSMVACDDAIDRMSIYPFWPNSTTRILCDKDHQSLSIVVHCAQEHTAAVLMQMRAHALCYLKQQAEHMRSEANRLEYIVQKNEMD